MAYCATILSNGIIYNNGQAVSASCQAVVFSGADYQAYLKLVAVSPAVPVPFDYSMAAQFWTFGFSTIILFYLTAYYAGGVVNFIRQHFR